MTNIPDLRDQAEVFDGNTVFDNVFILDTLDYDFKKSGTIEISNLQVVGVTTFAGDISVDEITVRNVDVTGIATVNTNLYVKGTLLDSSGDAGSAGQLLSSTGSGTNWIAANTTSVANAINVGVNLNSDNSDQFVSFFGGSSGNLPNRVDAGLKYNPSTNVLSAVKFSGDGSLLTNIQPGQVQGNSIFVSGMIILWSGTISSIPTGFVLCDGQNSTPDLRDKFIIGARQDNSGVAKSNVEGSLTQTGGSANATLVSHTHGAGSYSAVSNGSHTHQYDVRLNNRNLDDDEGNQTTNTTTTTNTTQSSGAHTHSISGSSDSTGSSSTNANLPPYFALAYIMKT